jgi:hypothetical protein
LVVARTFTDEDIEPVEEHNGEGENKMEASPGSRIDHKKSGEEDLRGDRWHLTNHC